MAHNIIFYFRPSTAHISPSTAQSLAHKLEHRGGVLKKYRFCRKKVFSKKNLYIFFYFTEVVGYLF